MEQNQKLQLALDVLIRSARSVLDESVWERRTKHVGLSKSLSNLEGAFNGYDKELKKYELDQATQAVTRKKVVETSAEAHEAKLDKAKAQFGDQIPSRPGTETDTEKIQSVEEA